MANLNTLSATVAAHQLVLERLLVRLFQIDPQGLADLEAECLSVDYPLYKAIGGERENAVLQNMLEGVEPLFAGVRMVRQGLGEFRDHGEAFQIRFGHPLDIRCAPVLGQ